MHGEGYQPWHAQQHQLFQPNAISLAPNATDYVIYAIRSLFDVVRNEVMRPNKARTVWSITTKV